jgi:Na+-driven multidrug efflux pump
VGGLQLGVGLGGALAVVLAAGRPAVVMAFTADPAVLGVLAGLYPWVFATQPVNALAFVWDGILYGANG